MDARSTGAPRKASSCAGSDRAARGGAEGGGGSAGYAGTIDAALVRLTSEDRTGMGRLFKAIAVANPKLERLPGFED